MGVVPEETCGWSMDEKQNALQPSDMGVDPGTHYKNNEITNVPPVCLSCTISFLKNPTKQKKQQQQQQQ